MGKDSLKFLTVEELRIIIQNKTNSLEIPKGNKPMLIEKVKQILSNNELVQLVEYVNNNKSFFNRNKKDYDYFIGKHQTEPTKDTESVLQPPAVRE